MRFAVVSLALCAAVNAVPVDTSAVTGLTNIVDTSSVTDSLPETGELGVRQVDTSSVTSLADTDEVTDVVPETSELGVRQVDTSSVTGLADTSEVTSLVPETSELGVRQVDTSSVTGLADTSAVTGLVPDTSELGVRQVDTSSVTGLADTSEVTSLVPETSELGVRQLNGGEDNFLSTASPDSGLVEDLILEIRHIRFAIVKGVKDELKDIDPAIGREVSQIINKLNQFERELFKDVGLPGNLFNKLKLVTAEIDKVVKSIEKLLINETGTVDPSLGNLVSQLSADVNSLGGNLVKILGLS